MARAMWRGAIQFGLVTIPLKMYVATESKGISFHMLHAADGSRIQMKTWCPVDEMAIPRSETVKGFEYAPDQYVVITDEDLEKVPLKTVRAIEIEQFVPAAEAAESIRFTKQAYYLEPDPVGRRAFYLLKAVLKDREQLAALDPFGDTMLLTTLYWPDEIRSTGELDLPEETVEVKAAEKVMAEQLVAAMTGAFDPTAYRDAYRGALMEVIEAKVAGAEPVAVAEPKEGGQLVDLMAALEASVAAAREGRAAEPAKLVPSRKRVAVPVVDESEEEAAAPVAAGKTRTAERRRKSA